MPIFIFIGPILTKSYEKTDNKYMPQMMCICKITCKVQNIIKTLQQGPSFINLLRVPPLQQNTE